MKWEWKFKRRIISGKDYQVLMDITDKIKGEKRTMSASEKRLCRVLRLARKISDKEFSPKIIRLGSQISLKLIETGNLPNVTLVLPLQENTKSFKVSVLSALGIQLFSSRKGQEIYYQLE